MRKLGKKVYDKDQETSSFEKLSIQRSDAIGKLNEKLLSAAKEVKTNQENVDALNKKGQLWFERANNAIKQLDSLKKALRLKKQKFNNSKSLIRKLLQRMTQPLMKLRNMN